MGQVFVMQWAKPPHGVPTPHLHVPAVKPQLCFQSGCLLTHLQGSSDDKRAEVPPCPTRLPFPAWPSYSECMWRVSH